MQPTGTDILGVDPHARVIYTGGTTGMPKGVMWRQEDIFYALCGGIDAYSNEKLAHPGVLAEKVAAGGGPTINFPIAPMMHGAGQVTTIRSLIHGDTVVLTPRFDAEQTWRVIASEKVNVLGITGDAMARPLADKLEEIVDDVDLSSLFSIGSSAAIFSQSIKDQLMEPKLNDSNSADQLLMVPNPDLKPEYSYNGELSIEKTFDSKFQIGVTGFYTLLKDALVSRPFRYNGQDSVVFDGVLCGVQALQNAEQAFIYGVEANVTASFTDYLSLSSDLTYTYGHVKGEDVSLDHIPPLFGITSLKLNLTKFSAEFYARYNGWKHIADYSPSGEDNETYATIDGMPSWMTLNLRASYQINEYLNVQAGLENILDSHYRLFASGISAPGRNAILSVRCYF